MSLMVWDNTLALGVQAMDGEHKELLALMNKIHDGFLAGAVVNDTVARLGAACARHFADEEAFMQSIAYPELNVHKLLHKQLLEKYAHHVGAIKAGGGKANEAFFSFLKLWLVSHIKGIDAKYAAHSRGAAR